MSAKSPDERTPPREKRFLTTVVEIEGREETKVVELPAFEPAAWGTDAQLSIVGQPVTRVDAREKVQGRAVYTADVARPGMLYAALVRATIPAGKVTALDVAPALAVPGVVDAISAGELPRPMRAGGVPLFDWNVSYAGQPLAAVCADSLAAARAGAAAVLVTYATGTHSVTYDDAMAPGAARVRPSRRASAGPPNVAYQSEASRGDVDAGLREAEVVVNAAFRTPSALHTAMEPHGAVAEWEGDRVTIWESTQGIFKVRDDVAGALGLPKSSVRVIKDHMGGGFGAKNSAGAHTFVAAVLARRCGRPVRCVLDRHGEQADSGHRPESHIRVTLGARRDGTLTAIVAAADVAMGIGGWEAPPTAIFHEMYACPNVKTSDTFAYVNSQAMAAFRAPGHVEGAFALERSMDMLARELQLDPLQLRLKNYAGRDQEKERPYSQDTLRACYEEGARRFGWHEREERRNSPPPASSIQHRASSIEPPASSIQHPASLLKGFGLAAQIWGAGGGPPAYATVRINSDGTADVLSGTQDLGTGARTIFAQIAAESLGARLADVRVILGDTERTPYASNSWGSMTTASVGPAVRMAAVDAQKRLFEAAAELLECHPDDLTALDSTVTTRDGARQLAFGEITKRLGNVMIMGQGSRGPNRRGVGLVSVGVQFAEVEVDLELGRVRVVKIVAVHDAGRIINPLLAQSQLEGGIIQGLGFALFEDRIIDRATGLPLNPELHDYKIPMITDMPVIDATCLSIPDTTANHVGARGLAEPPIIPTAPAIANAVADALGVDVNELPLTPWRVLGAVRASLGVR